MLPVSETYKAQILAKRPHFKQVAREHYGLEVNVGPFGINSRPSLIGAKYAEGQGVGEAYHAAVMQAYWQEARSLAEMNVLTEIAQDIGLETEAFLVALDEPEYTEAVFKDVAQARAYGIQGVPALILGDKYLLSGAQPYEVLVQAVEQIQQKQKFEV